MSSETELADILEEIYDVGADGEATIQMVKENKLTDAEFVIERMDGLIKRLGEQKDLIGLGCSAAMDERKLTALEEVEFLMRKLVNFCKEMKSGKFQKDDNGVVEDSQISESAKKELGVDDGSSDNTSSIEQNKKVIEDSHKHCNQPVCQVFEEINIVADIVEKMAKSFDSEKSLQKRHFVKEVLWSRIRVIHELGTNLGNISEECTRRQNQLNDLEWTINNYNNRFEMILADDKEFAKEMGSCFKVLGAEQFVARKSFSFEAMRGESKSNTYSAEVCSSGAVIAEKKEDEMNEKECKKQERQLVVKQNKKMLELKCAATIQGVETEKGNASTDSTHEPIAICSRQGASSESVKIATVFDSSKDVATSSDSFKSPSAANIIKKEKMAPFEEVFDSGADGTAKASNVCKDDIPTEPELDHSEYPDLQYMRDKKFKTTNVKQAARNWYGDGAKETNDWSGRHDSSISVQREKENEKDEKDIEKRERQMVERHNKKVVALKDAAKIQGGGTEKGNTSSDSTHQESRSPRGTAADATTEQRSTSMDHSGYEFASKADRMAKATSVSRNPISKTTAVNPKETDQKGCQRKNIWSKTASPRASASPKPSASPYISKTTASPKASPRASKDQESRSPTAHATTEKRTTFMIHSDYEFARRADGMTKASNVSKTPISPPDDKDKSSTLQFNTTLVKPREAVISQNAIEGKIISPKAGKPKKPKNDNSYGWQQVKLKNAAFKTVSKKVYSRLDIQFDANGDKQEDLKTEKVLVTGGNASNENTIIEDDQKSRAETYAQTKKTSVEKQIKQDQPNEERKSFDEFEKMILGKEVPVPYPFDIRRLFIEIRSKQDAIYEVLSKVENLAVFETDNTANFLDKCLEDLRAINEDIKKRIPCIKDEYLKCENNVEMARGLSRRAEKCLNDLRMKKEKNPDADKRYAKAEAKMKEEIEDLYLNSAFIDVANPFNFVPMFEELKRRQLAIDRFVKESMNSESLDRGEKKLILKENVEYVDLIRSTIESRINTIIEAENNCKFIMGMIEKVVKDVRNVLGRLKTMLQQEKERIALAEDEKEMKEETETLKRLLAEKYLLFLIENQYKKTGKCTINAKDFIEKRIKKCRMKAHPVSQTISDFYEHIKTLELTKDDEFELEQLSRVVDMDDGEEWNDIECGFAIHRIKKMKIISPEFKFHFYL